MSIVLDSFEGRLFLSSGKMIGEFDDIIAFPYRNYTNNKNYLHFINGEGIKDYLIPSSEGMHSTYVCAVMTARDEIWIAFNRPIILNQYRIGEDSLTLLSSFTLGNNKSSLKDLIVLDNGKLFIAWHQTETGKVDPEGNQGLDVGFAYRTLDGAWHTIPYTWVYPFGIPATQGAVCQHPADGSIWFFFQPDSRGITCVIHLIESNGEISVDWTDYNFLNKDSGVMAPNGELPFFSAVADKERNAIILAYQSKDMKIFSYDPFCKGAKPAIIQVNSDKSKSLLFVLNKWAERVSPLRIGLNKQNEIWLASAVVDEVNLTLDDLYISTKDKDIYCGKLHSYGGVKFCNSSKLVMATLSNGYTYSLLPEEIKMQFIIDVSSWTQTEKNYLQAAAVSLLFQAGITYDDISASNGLINILNPSSNVSAILTEANLKAFIVAKLEEIKQATQEAQLEAKAREAELELSEFRDIKLIDIDAKIDAIANLNQLKVLLKKFIRFVIARS